MSMERRIDLNVSVPDFRGQEFQTGGQRQSALPQPDAQAKSRFDEALAGKNTSEAQPEVAERGVRTQPVFSVWQPATAWRATCRRSGASAVDPHRRRH